MYNLSPEFSAAARSNTRKILPKVVFNDTAEFFGDHIIDISVTEATNASGGISMGNTIATQLKMTARVPDVLPLLDGGWVHPSIAFNGVYFPADFIVTNGILTGATEMDSDGILHYVTLPEITDAGILTLGAFDILEYCPLGKFYISEATSKNDFKATFEIIAYDAFSKTEKTYTPTIPMPNTSKAILADIATQCGFSISSGVEYPEGLFDLYDFTCRQYIGYFAGLTGKNARFDRNGNLAFVWYTDHGYTVEPDNQYMGGLTRLTEAPAQVQSIVSGTSENTIVSGTGQSMSFENPFMTQEILDRIFETVGAFSYIPLKVKWRGNPAIEVGDILTVDDKGGTSYTVYVMEQTFKISGGMYSEIKCYGQSEAEISFSTSPTQKKLQQVYTKLQQAIQEATTLLSGANGGIFEIIDEDGNGLNDGWIIHSVDGQKFIKANINGIGITEDGGATFAEALTSKGLNASAITTGQLNAQRVAVGDASLGDVFNVGQDEQGRIMVTIGASDSDIKQQQTNDAITFVDKCDNQVAKFSITGAEWQSMQQMKYCGFLWTKSAASGNVRFTKVEEE